MYSERASTMSSNHTIELPNLLNKKSNKNFEDCDECVKCGALCCAGILTLGLIIGGIGATILYLIFAILALWNDKDLSDNCSNSHLWYYLLVSLISGIVLKLNEYNMSKDNETENDKGITIIINGLTVVIVQFGLAIWGFLEVSEISFDENNISNLTVITNNTDYHCKELAESQIFTMSVISMSVQFASGALGILIVLCIIKLLFK